MTEEQIAFLAETLAEEIEEHHDNAIDVDVGIHDLAVHAGQEMANSGVVRDLLEALEALMGSVDALISESEGVYGLHLNGDPAPWLELTEGGQFEEWLLSLEKARAAIAKARGEKP